MREHYLLYVPGVSKEIKASNMEEGGEDSTSIASDFSVLPDAAEVSCVMLSLFLAPCAIPAAAIKGQKSNSNL